MFILSLQHLTTLRLSDTPTGGAVDKGIFVKFEEKLRSAIFFLLQQIPWQKIFIIINRSFATFAGK